MPYDEHEPKEFPSGLYIKRPHPNAPDFVKARISIKVADFQQFLSTKDSEWIRLDVKEGFKIGDDGLKKWYAEVDTWTPKSPSRGETGSRVFPGTAYPMPIHSHVARTEPDDDAF